ncbi:MAG: SLC13 family permease [Verrucomicrobiales bacterium]|nr:SLC13 family permease [Verrucomicrobiales bacterium]
MNLQIILTLTIVVLALVLFWWERHSADVIAVGVLAALVLTGLLPAEQAFLGFGSNAIITILGLLILTAALHRTGVVDLVTRAVLGRAGDDIDRLLWAIMITSAGLGAFISNTASTAFFVPIVFGIARKAHISASKLLMPLAFSSILTSSVTLISTSTNLVVSGVMTRHQMPALGMFELAPVGLPIAVVGLLYMFYIGQRLIPERTPVTEMTERFGVQPYLSEVVVQPNSALAGKTLAEAKVSQTTGLNTLRIIRDADQHIEPHAETPLKVGDILLVEGSQDDILKIKDTAGLEIKADVQLSDRDLEHGEMALAEAVVLTGSPLIGRTLRGVRLRERYGVQVIGLNHRGVNVVEKLGDVPIRLGDVLLLQGRRNQLTRLQNETAFHILRPLESMAEVRPRRNRAAAAVGIFGGVIALASFDVLTPAVAMMIGVLLVFLTRCLTPEEAYAAVEWRAIVLIGSMLGLGLAMEQTGTAAWLAQLIVSWTQRTHPIWLLSGFFLLTVLLTQPMSNQAAAIVVLPIALQTADQVGLNPRTFAVMIAVAASCSYLTPLEPACLMVYGPGRYRFADFLKVGSFLTVLIFLIAIWLVPSFWPLRK